jgi:cellulose synthase/poly-beta-1,6-N-acetylglucosamine synthase-like glycosyltransferase
MIGLLCGGVVGLLLACVAYVLNMANSRLIYEQSERKGPPSLSVVIASRNEELVIEKTIRNALSHAACPTRVLVVDESTDATPSILKRLACEFPNLTVLSNEEGRGKPAALNTALKHVDTDVVLFLDADGRFDASSIAQYLKVFARTDVDAIFADFASYNARRTFAVVVQDILFSFAKCFLYSGIFVRPLIMNSGFFVRTEILREVGKFAPDTLVDDYDLRGRMGAKGYKIRFVLGPKCRIQYALSMSDFFHQQCRWFTGWIRTSYEGIARGQWRLVPALGGLVLLVFFPYFALLLSYLLSSPVPLVALLSVIMTAYSATCLSYLIYDARSLREATLNLVFGAFLIYFLFQVALLISFFKALHRRQTWYKASREAV